MTSSPLSSSSSAAVTTAGAGDGAPLQIVVFVGTRGRGSNLRALHDAVGAGRLHARVALVVGSRAGAPALEWAEGAGLEVAVLDPKTWPDEGGYTDALLGALQAAGAEALALAGYLRRLPSLVVALYRHRIVNIHPSLLPAFGGKGMYGEHVHRAVLGYGAKVSGCTAHFVDEEYDTGPIIVQRVVPVREGDTPETLAARVLPHEHAALVESLQLLAHGRLLVEGRVVRVAPAPAMAGEPGTGQGPVVY